MTHPALTLVDEQDLQLAKIREYRNTWIEQATRKGTVFPDDPECMQALAKLMKDSDDQALKLKKLKIEDQANKQNGESAALVAQLLSKISGVMNAPETVSDRAAPSLAANDHPTTMVEGMLDDNPIQETSRQFRDRMALKNSEDSASTN